MKWCRIGLVLLILLLFTACSSKTSDDQSAESSNAPGGKADTRGLTVALSKNPLNLDPRFNIDAASYRITNLVFNGLVKKDARLNLVPDLAESWDMTDEQTWVFHLRRGVRFHNGREMTSADVAYTFRSIMDPAFRSPKAHAFSRVDRIDTPEAATVVFHTTEPFAPLLTDLTLGIVPAEEAQAAGDGFSDAPVGTGPYRFVSRAADQYVDLAAFADYFGGAPKLPAIRFRIIPDDTTRYLELVQGNVDFVHNAITPDMVPQAEKQDSLKVVRDHGTNYTYLAFNLKDPVLGKLKVRQAIAHALNVPEMIQFLLGGLGLPATGLLPPGHWAYEPDVAAYAFDPLRAEALLDEAGHPRQADGFRFTLTYKTTQGDLAKLKAETIQEQLRKVGIKLDIRMFDWGTFFSDVKAGDFQLYSLEWVGITEPDIYQYVFASDMVPPEGANRGYYSNPEVDRLIEAGRHTLDQEKRRPIYSQLQKIIAADLPYVSLWYATNVAAMKKDLQGYVPFPDGTLTCLAEMSWGGGGQ